jgi:dipeptidyl aminopeptidase/acylaminoacyl peptidase
MGRFAGALIAATLVLLAPDGAEAAFPGQNGKIAFASGADIWAVDPSGTGLVNLTQSAVAEADPTWSPDGARIAYTRGSGDQREIWVMNADGSGQSAVVAQPFTCPGAPFPGCDVPSVFDPAWSPDGAWIAFVSGDSHCSSGGLYRVHPDGTGVVRITDVCEDGESPSWSPDGSRIVVDNSTVYPPHETIFVDPTGANRVTREGLGNQPNWSPGGSLIAGDQYVFGDAGIYTYHPDGTGLTQISAQGYKPAWSPDGRKIVVATETFSSTAPLAIMNANGSNLTPIPGAAGDDPDWQPILHGYARPKAATPFYVPLVPAQTLCGSANRVHAAPLTYGACSPASQTSGFATVGTADANGAQSKSTGFVKLRWIGELPIDPNNGNQADVVIDAQVTDVRNKAAITDYTGGLRARIARQITDKQNTPYPGGAGPGTGQAPSFEFNIPCTTTPDATVGSTCSVSTTANTLVPGQVLEQKRAVWELGRIEVWDGGTDGNPSTAGDNTLFATQGVFIP